MIDDGSLYDSHLHLRATGEVALGLDLHGAQSWADFRGLSFHNSHFRGQWLVGFGWDHNLFNRGEWPTANQLDEILALKSFQGPAALTRVDGHTSWLNSEALCQASALLKKDLSFSTGILSESDKVALDMVLPPYSEDQVRNQLQVAHDRLKALGYTHVRDMSGDESQWKLLLELERSRKWDLVVIQNFTCESLQDLSRTLDVCRKVRANPSACLKLGGVKIYLDGALGSDTAYLSAPYPQSNQRGQVFWSEEQLTLAMTRTWSEGFDFCVHVIGDEAAHMAISAAHQIFSTSSVRGHLHLEHVQLLRPESLSLLVGLSVTCHMQPSHFLSDQAWLKQKTRHLNAWAFPWSQLEEAGIQVRFGSDSPIEHLGLSRTEMGLSQAQLAGIPAPRHQARYYHQFVHPHLTS